jgi:DNA-binding GntR family transcriptional regulator
MSESPAAPASSSSLQIEIANRVIAMIRSGALGPGKHVTEQGMAQQFGVSRSPVRGALKLLEERGYVQSRANAGVFIAEQAPALPLDALVGSVMTADELYRAIISDRARHVLDDVLSEVALLERYDAPKGVLLRTLSRMAHEGLIERAKGHGWRFFPGLDSKEAKDESYRFRMIVECQGLREPTFRADPEKLAFLRREHEVFLAMKPAAQTPAAFFELNATFHETIASLSGNRFVFQAVRQQNQLRRFEEYQHIIGRPAALFESCHEHLAIIDALQAGETEWAAAQLHHHLDLATRA